MTSTLWTATPTPTPYEVAAELLSPTPDPYVTQPAAWIKDKLGEYTWTKQQAICQSVVDHRYTCVQSSHDTGKSFIAARIAAWWIETHPVGSAFVVSTAPTDPQVKAILWRELKRAHRKGELRGRITLDARWMIEEELVAYGRKPNDYDPAAFQGIHALYVLVIIDEACGVPKNLFDAADSLATNEHARVLAIGNPDDPTAHFAEVCKPGSGWNAIRIDAFDTPNFTGEHIPEELSHLLVSETWVEERRKRWGVQSPLWQSKVRGLFPDVSDNSLIHPSWVLAAQVRDLEPDIVDSSLGADIARFGSSETVVYMRQGGHVRLVHTGRRQPTTATAGQLKRIHRAHPAWPPISVDDNGVGGGVTDQLREDDLPVVPLNGGEAATDSSTYFNARAEWYWQVRLALEAGELDLDPLDEDLASQLLQIQYSVDSRGRIHIETKDEMRKRGVPSPDRADGLVYSLVKRAPVVVSHQLHHGQQDPMPESDIAGNMTEDLMKAEW